MKTSIDWVSTQSSYDLYNNALIYAQRLIKCGSFNPPGNELSAALFAKEILSNAGFTVEVQEFEKNRCNVVATYGNSQDIALILNGHLDVVPAFGKWSKDPLSAERLKGILYGRGSSDMLGGCAAILSAAELIGKSNISPKRGIMILLVSDEEDTNRGIRHILKEGPIKADCAIIAEPTECEIHLGNRGFAGYYIKATGKACHASKPWQGENAIYKMGYIIRAIEEYADSLKDVTNKYLGQATACIGTITGGIRLNTVPDECIIEVERRLLPGETQSSIREELEKVVGSYGVVSDKSWFPASLINKEHPLVKNCYDGLSELLTNEPTISIFPACAETSMFSYYCDIPTLLLGPGSLEQAHRIDEFCKESDITTCAELYAALIHHYISE